MWLAADSFVVEIEEGCSTTEDVTGVSSGAGRGGEGGFDMGGEGYAPLYRVGEDRNEFRLRFRLSRRTAK